MPRDYLRTLTLRPPDQLAEPLLRLLQLPRHLTPPKFCPLWTVYDAAGKACSTRCRISEGCVDQPPSLWHSQLTGDKLGQESVAEGGEGTGLLQIRGHPIVERCHLRLERG